MSSRPDMTDEQRQLAAEHALGLLEGRDLERARALLREDAEFQREVARWRGRLAPLFDGIDSVQPSRRVWDAIGRHIEPTQTDNVVVLRRRLNAWKGAAAAATALAAALAVVTLIQPSQLEQPPAVVPGAPPMTALLRSEDQQTMLVATWDPRSGQLAVAEAGQMPSDAGRTHELWVIPGGGQPRSLGVMPTGRKMRMQVTGVVAGQLRQGATLAVSVEPSGGSPTGLPTGPVIASGSLERA